MKHIRGNGTRCSDCFWYREKEQGDKCRYDGWCVNPEHLRIGINGHLRIHIPERESRMKQWDCRMWEDAETRLTHYEVNTGEPEPWKSDVEKERIRGILNDCMCGGAG